MLLVMRPILALLLASAFLPATYAADEKILVQRNNLLKTGRTEALPVGNGGELGAMVFGKTDLARIQFNEKSLWTAIKK
jgi:hypothetical protein